MSWLFVAIIAYFIIALGVILDKFLLSSKRVSHPAVYAFYSGILSFFTLFFFAPFGFHGVIFLDMIKMFFFGMVFLYGIFFLFFAIRRSEASRAIPVVGAVIPLVTLVIEVIFFGNNFTNQEMLGVFILIFGGLLISFNLPMEIGKRKFFDGLYFSILAGVFLAMAYSGADYFFEKDNFSNVFSWTRIGVAMGALSLLIVPIWRKKILNSIFSFKKEKKKNFQTGNLFVFNKILNGVGSILVHWAIAIGSVTMVNALVSIEYVFVFLLAIIFHGIFPDVFSEKNRLFDILQKIAAIFIIAIGIFMITI